MHQARISFGLSEAAGLIGVSASKLRKLIRAGDLKATRIGRRVLLRASEIDRLLKRGEGQQPTRAA